MLSSTKVPSTENSQQTKTSPLISVITVCRNAEHTIAEALTSVQRQSWEAVEHIVIDGASSDQTLAIIKRNDSRVRTVISEPDSGIYDAMNKGLRQATGQIICFLNSDDRYSSPEVLSRVAERMSNCDNLALLGNVGFVKSMTSETIVRCYDSGRFTPSKLAWGIMPAHPGLFLSRDIITRTGEFNPTYRIAGDYDYVLRVFKDGGVRIERTSEIVVLMKLGGISTATWRSRLQLTQEVLRACRANGVRTNLAMILAKYPLKLLEYVQ